MPVGMATGIPNYTTYWNFTLFGNGEIKYKLLYSAITEETYLVTNFGLKKRKKKKKTAFC